MLAITDCTKTYWRNIHKQFQLQHDPNKYAKSLDAVRLHACCQGMRSFILSGRLLELNKSFQCMNSCRQAAKDFCKEKGIPLKEAMVMLDMDYASEA